MKNKKKAYHSFVSLKVKETVPELKALCKRVRPLYQSRIKFLILAKKESKFHKVTVAAKLGVWPHNIGCWISRYKKWEIDALVNPRFYSNRRIIPKVVHIAIERRLKKKNFKGYAELYNWVKENHLPDIKYGTLSRYVRRNFNNPVSPSRVGRLKVKESLSKLNTLYKEYNDREAKRIKMLIEVKKGEIDTMKELGEAVGVNVFTLRTWFTKYNAGGIENLLKNKNDRD